MSQQTISKKEISHEFNPLLRNEPLSREALFYCAVLLLRPKHIWSDWRAFSEWIGGYEYILPADRTILDDLAILLIQRVGYKRFSQIYFNILTNFSTQTQQDLIDYLRKNPNELTELNGHKT